MPIPKVLHRVWLGSPVPDWAQDIYESWTRLHPDWKHVLWTERQLPILTEHNKALYDLAPVAVQRVTSGSIWQFRSDLVRYEVLSQFGGVYVDCDLEALKPIDEFTDGDFFAGWEIQDEVIGNTILGCTPGHPFMTRLRDRLTESVEWKLTESRRRTATWVSGPRYVTRHAMVHGLSRLNILPQHTFYPFGYSEAHRFYRSGIHRTRFQNSYAVHWWNNQRTRRKLPL